MKNRIKQTFFPGSAAVLLLATVWMLMALPTYTAQAADATPVAIEEIDYEYFTAKVKPNGNSVVYYSTNEKTWYELEENLKDVTDTYMDISWVSLTSDVTLYFKGSENKTVTSVELPKRTSIKVKFNKVDGNLEFSGCDEASEFEWRKSTDYNWQTVPINETKDAHKAFLKTLENFRNRGASLVVRTAQKKGSERDPGLRPSKPVAVSISKRSSAPSLKINLLKLTVNTKDTMEYFSVKDNKWIACEKDMALKKLFPTVENPEAKNLTVKIRTAETEKKPYTKTAILQTDGQGKAPTTGDSTKDVTYYYNNNKLVLQFNQADSSSMYEYAVLKPGMSITSGKISWKSVRKSEPIQVSASTAPKGSTIYVREKGITGNARKNIVTTLPSLMSSFNVTY